MARIKPARKRSLKKSAVKTPQYKRMMIKEPQQDGIKVVVKNQNPFLPSSMEDMLSAAQALSLYAHGGILDTSQCSPKAKLYVESIDSRNHAALALQKLNHKIVIVNAKENKPTRDTRKIYESLLERG